MLIGDLSAIQGGIGMGPGAVPGKEATGAQLQMYQTQRGEVANGKETAIAARSDMNGGQARNIGSDPSLNVYGQDSQRRALGDRMPGPRVGDGISTDFRKFSDLVARMQPNGMAGDFGRDGLRKSQRRSTRDPKDIGGQVRDITLDSMNSVGRSLEYTIYLSALMASVETTVGSLKRLQQG